VVERQGEIVFVEVKTRRPGPAPAREAVRWSQRRHLRRAAAAWMRQNPVGESFRFDLVAITWPRLGEPRIEHFPGVLEDADP
jgi:putative endonuclease